MSLKAKILNKNSLKLAAAISIPCFLVWVFIYAQHLANVEVKKYKQEQQENPNLDSLTVSNYELKEVDDNNDLRWRLTASQGVVAEGNHSVALENVKVEYFDGDQVKMRMEAPKGEANESTRHVRLTADGNRKVLATGEGDSTKLQAEVVELTKKNQFTASGGVNIDLPRVAKVTGDKAEGTIEGTEISNFKVMGNTHAQIFTQGKDSTNVGG